ncbi:MAG: hypothetical protein KGL39_05645 [Patescibacteria group bacterium]|nr:hypothetical protein [Patescibacteria group bacterium]
MDSLAILQRFGTGQLIDELATALAEVSAEVVQTGNPGRVSVTFDLKNQNGAGDVIVLATPKISRTTPKREVRGAMFFAVDDGLHQEDPRQMRLEFRSVDTSTGEIRSIDSERDERVAE